MESPASSGTLPRVQASSVIIRAAHPRDTETIANYNIRLAWETEALRLDPATVTQGVVAILSDASRGSYFVAEAESSVVGQCCVTYEWSDWRNGMIWWLQSVYVSRDWRGRGIFTMLFEKVRTAAVSEKAVGLRLYVEQENRSAQRVYERLGMSRTHYQVFELAFSAGPPPNPDSTSAG